jgi:[acyl-carrier-protein] S-malonyltransferase
MERPGMGLALAAAHPEARALLEEAGAQVGREALALLARGDRALERTEVLQPILTAVSLGAAAALGAGRPRPACVAGHSLGELAAWAAAGGIAPVTAIRLAAQRGAAMAAAAAEHPGGMVAVLADEATARAALALGQQHGTVALAAHNAASEWVLAGDRAALSAIARRFPVRRLAAAGPWHSPLVSPAQAAFAAAVRAAPQGPCAVVLIANRTGEPAAGEDLPRLIGEQLVLPVAWAHTLRTLADRGITHFVTVGPGDVLRGLLRKNLGPGVQVLGTETPEEVAHTRQALLTGSKERNEA